MSSVTLYAYDLSDGTKNTPVDAVTVFVFSEDGSTFIESGETDSDGEVVFELPNEIYWVRFFKQGFSFAKKLSIEVTEDSDFEVGGQNLEVRPPATQNNLCRVSGYVMNAGGQHLPDVTAEFAISDYARISAGRMVGAEKVITYSDEDGYFEFDLLRGARYDAVVESFGDQVFHILVPDLSFTHFTDLIWPFVARVELSASSVSLGVGDTEDVTAVGVLSSGVEGRFPSAESMKDPDTWRLIVSAKSSDTQVATVAQNDEVLTITAVGAGTCEIQFTPRITAARRLPVSTVELDTISVTVS